MDSAFFDAVRSSLFGGSLTQDQVDWLDGIGIAWDRNGDGDLRKLAYILATSHHETGRYKWMVEIWGPTPAQKRYEGRTDLGNTLKGDGKKFMGRGPVMLTGRRNYADWSKRLGIDLVKEPQLAADPEIGGRILVQGSMLGTFTGKKLGDYINAGGADFRNARRVINGTDRADMIAAYAQKYLKALEKSAPAPTKPETTERPSGKRAAGWAAVLGALGAAVFAFLKSNGWI